MAVQSMILFLVFLPSLPALPYKPLMVNIDEKGALVKERLERPLVRVEKSGKQTANEIEPTIRILDDGMSKGTHSKVGHDTNAKLVRKQHPKVETHLEKENATSVALNAETSGEMSAVPKDKPSDHKQRVSWDEDEDDGDTALDELEALFDRKNPPPEEYRLVDQADHALLRKKKKDEPQKPPPEDCRYNSWIMSGGCKGSGCSCGCNGEQEYTRSKIPENFGGRPCTESDTKTESCQLPACPPTPAPTPPPTFATTTTLAFATRTGSMNLFSWLALLTAVLYNIR